MQPDPNRARQAIILVAALSCAVVLMYLGALVGLWLLTA